MGQQLETGLKGAGLRPWWVAAHSTLYHRTELVGQGELSWSPFLLCPF